MNNYYDISKQKRMYSSTPIVRVTIDEKNKEQEEIVCVCTGKKAVADELAEVIVQLLNANERIKYVDKNSESFMSSNVRDNFLSDKHNKWIDESWNYVFDKNNE